MNMNNLNVKKDVAVSKTNKKITFNLIDNTKNNIDKNSKEKTELKIYLQEEK